MTKGTGKNSLSRNIHVVPIGFEFERAVAPFQSRSVDKIILVADKSSENQIPYTRKVRDYFELNLGLDVSVVYADTFSLSDIVRVLSQIIRSEKEAGNQVSINVSSAGRLVSIGAAFAGMAHDVNVYYVKADSYSTSKKELEEFGVSRCSMSDPEIETLVNYKINLINEETALVLEYFYLSKVSLDTEWISFSALAGVLHLYNPKVYLWDPCGGKNPFKSGQPGYAEYREEKWQFVGRFTGLIGKQLELNNFIERKPGERRRALYRITPTGEYALFMSGISGLVRVEKGKIVYRGK